MRKKRGVVLKESYTDRVSLKEQDSHLKIFNETVNKEAFEGIHVKGEFEEPALVFSLDRFPSTPVANMMKNVMSREEDDDYNLYIYSRGAENGIKWGKINADIDKIYLLEELLSRYELELVEIKDNNKKKLELNDFITTITF